MKKMQYIDAIEDCHSLLDIDSRNVNAYYLIGCAHEKLAEVEYAIENFTIVIELDPTHVNAFLARGACLNKLGQFKEALDDYDIALKLDSEKSKTRKSRNYPSSRKGFKDNEEDIQKPHENKFKPLEIDTSHIQGHTETVLQRQNSNSSLQKVSSVRNSQEDNSLQDISFSHTESSK